MRLTAARVITYERTQPLAKSKTRIDDADDGSTSSPSGTVSVSFSKHCGLFATSNESPLWSDGPKTAKSVTGLSGPSRLMNWCGSHFFKTIDEPSGTGIFVSGCFLKMNE